MHLYNLTLQGVIAIDQAVHACFPEFLNHRKCAWPRGSVVQLLFCDPKTGKISVLCSQEIFGVIRSLLAFRRTGGAKDVETLRLPKNAIEEVQEDPTRVRALWDRGNLNGASQKLEQICQFYIGDMITSLQKTSLVPGSADGLVYTTISGSIGMLVPFLSRDEYESFQTLEMHMRVEFPPLCGRDHLAYRSFYAPAKSMVDFCEQFTMLESGKQRDLSKNLDMLPTMVIKKLEDLRTRYAF